VRHFKYRSMEDDIEEVQKTVNPVIASDPMEPWREFLEEKGFIEGEEGMEDWKITNDKIHNFDLDLTELVMDGQPSVGVGQFVINMVKAIKEIEKS